MGRKPNVVIACVGRGSNAMRLFHEFDDKDVRVIEVEGINFSLDGEKQAATLTKREFGVMHEVISDLLQYEYG